MILSINKYIYLEVVVSSWNCRFDCLFNVTYSSSPGAEVVVLTLCLRIVTYSGDPPLVAVSLAVDWLVSSSKSFSSTAGPWGLFLEIVVYCGLPLFAFRFAKLLSNELVEPPDWERTRSYKLLLIVAGVVKSLLEVDVPSSCNCKYFSSCSTPP